jgi:hypothetical protein
MEHKEAQNIFDLAKLLHQHVHPEDAVDAFKPLIDAEGPFRQDARFYTIDALCLLGRTSEAIELYENQIPPENLPDDLAIKLANCYLQEDDEKGVVGLLLPKLARFPSIQPNHYKQLQSGEPKKIKIGRKMLREAIKNGLSPYVVFEYLLPVHFGLRDVACCSSDELLIYQRSDGIEVSLLDYLASAIYTQFGLRLFVVNYLSRVFSRCMTQAKVFIYRSPDTLRSLISIKEKWEGLVSEKILDADRFLFREEGRLLGYPSCCVDWAESHRFSSSIEKDDNERLESFEKLASKELIFYISSDPDEIIPVAYYTYEFYPCSPECEKAETVGLKHMAEACQVDDDFAEIFVSILLPAHTSSVASWHAGSPDKPQSLLWINEISRQICDYFNLDWRGNDFLRDTLESNVVLE